MLVNIYTIDTQIDSDIHREIDQIIPLTVLARQVQGVIKHSQIKINPGKSIELKYSEAINVFHQIMFLENVCMVL